HQLRVCYFWDLDGCLYGDPCGVRTVCDGPVSAADLPVRTDDESAESSGIRGESLREKCTVCVGGTSEVFCDGSAERGIDRWAPYGLQLAVSGGMCRLSEQYSSGGSRREVLDTDPDFRV